MADKKLYIIRNYGCGDTTSGLAELTDEEYERFIKIIEDLNKNSQYCLMPVIHVTEIDRNTICEYNSDPLSSAYKELIMYLNSKPYVFIKDISLID